MAARHKGVRRGSSVRVHGGLAAQPQGHVGPHAPAQGTFTACCVLALSWLLLPLGSLAPVVASVDMAACEVDPGLTLLKADVTNTQRTDICLGDSLRLKGKKQTVVALWELCSLRMSNETLTRHLSRYKLQFESNIPRWLVRP